METIDYNRYTTMTKTKTVSQEEALKRIDGWIVADKVLYYDDSMQRYYVGLASDLNELCELMASDDEDISRDAYSHWCAGTSHGDGYKTQAEAEAAANQKQPQPGRRS